VEQLSDSISAFAFSLGGLSFICALLFAIDLFFFRQMAKSKDQISQTHLETAIEATYKTENYISKTNNKIKPFDQCCSSKNSNNAKKLTYLRTDV